MYTNMNTKRKLVYLRDICIILQRKMFIIITFVAYHHNQRLSIYGLAQVQCDLKSSTLHVSDAK